MTPTMPTSTAAVSVFALTTRGLEALTLAELSALPGVSAVNQTYRRVSASFTGDLTDLLSLRTADDVFLRVDAWASITHTRAALADLTARAAALDLDQPLETLRMSRAFPHDLTYSLTANFVGKRNYSVPEIKTALMQGIAMQGIGQRYPHWRYVDDDVEAVLNLRLFIEHERAILGLRIGERPLHRRAYKQSHLPGSLKPPVAAAMVMLGGFQQGQTILDPFCGSGTIPIEAGLVGLQAMGSDLSTEVLADAQQNAHEANLPGSWLRSDANRLPLPAQRLDGIVTNLPWGRQIEAAGVQSLAELYRQSACESQRVTKADGHIILLMPAEYIAWLDVDTLGWWLLSQTEISLFGQTPSIFVFQNAGSSSQPEAGLIR